MTAHTKPTKKTSKRSKKKTLIRAPHSNDVLCGRGGTINSHAGNLQFREMVAKHKKVYLNSRFKQEKRLVAEVIVADIRALNPPGRFLAKDTRTDAWYDVGDEKARDKTGQALRENAPALRDELVTAHATRRKKEASSSQDNAAGGSINPAAVAQPYYPPQPQFNLSYNPQGVYMFSNGYQLVPPFAGPPRIPLHMVPHFMPNASAPAVYPPPMPVVPLMPQHAQPGPYTEATKVQLPGISVSVSLPTASSPTSASPDRRQNQPSTNVRRGEVDLPSIPEGGDKASFPENPSVASGTDGSGENRDTTKEQSRGSPNGLNELVVPYSPVKIAPEPEADVEPLALQQGLVLKHYSLDKAVLQSLDTNAKDGGDSCSNQRSTHKRRAENSGYSTPPRKLRRTENQEGERTATKMGSYVLNTRTPASWEKTIQGISLSSF